MNVYEELRNRITNKSPWDTEVTFLRQSLRKRLQSDLLMGSDNDVSANLHNIWHETTHNLIIEYRRRLKNIDSSSKPNKVWLERRRVLQNFIDFMKKDEVFYRSIIARTITLFGLDEYTHLLAQIEPNKNVVNSDDTSSDDGRADVSLDYSNQVAEEGTFDKNTRVYIIYRCLIFLGDIARYKELYNQEGGRPKAGVQYEQNSRHRQYANALLCYELAQSIMPSEGMHFNSLATLASYRDDFIAVVYNYYRGLTLSSPQHSKWQQLARNNLKQVLTKVLDEENNVNDDLRIFTVQLLKIHGMLFLNRTDYQTVSKLINSSLRQFQKLLDSGTLRNDVILKIVTINISLHYHLRVYRDIESIPNKMSLENRRNTAHKYLIRVVTILMKHVRASLAEVELEESAQDDIKLASLLTTSMRRCLPTLRLFMHWLTSNIDHHNKVKASSKSNSIPQFWEEFEQFKQALSSSFENLKIDRCEYSLEEDEEFQQFNPIKRCPMRGMSKMESNELRRQRHPNDEQLERGIIIIRLGTKL
ncbi:hypothetical protein E3Q06_02755 [Wallemia mellicola]|nr:hypothetical protein E3Q21_02768 [Wallemia mellicola]TIB86554.1 hypothetical protein E3Q20_02760 [Wallemia mellicola]TIC35117.1 hypothetical protein E3Q09_02529 [Wallemia mellicola]TIC39618.1 hypothetical protein E3Q07_02777 [Wallemia mellicola]TIC47929.1 hypothetical protein E3Q06_02755 [Wallemia mellicola]